MIALLDGDIIAYRCAASADTEEDVAVALIRTDALMREVLTATGATQYKVFLSGKKEDNFRYRVDPNYKINRVSMVRPMYLDSCKQFLVTNWEAVVCDGAEADDGLGIYQSLNIDTIICSIDKDLLQVPGRHYNFVKKVFTEVTPDQGLKAFFTQTLVGDASDGIVGIKGIGPVKAAKILDPLLPEEYYETCKELYNDDIRYHSNCQLLWILREPRGFWTPPGTSSGSTDVKGEKPDIPGIIINTTTRYVAVPKNTDTSSEILSGSLNQ